MVPKKKCDNNFLSFRKTKYIDKNKQMSMKRQYQKNFSRNLVSSKLKGLMIYFKTSDNSGYLG